MIELNHDSVDKTETLQEIHHDLKYERDSSDSWSHIYILLRSLQTLSKQMEKNRLEAQQCLIYCHELSNKSQNLIQELNG